jgi:hypothetical protein
VAVGLATLMRPQSLVFAPLLGALAVASGQTWRQTLARRGAAALTVTLLTLGLCLPWTIRNCQRMRSCALVSVNGGWNLLIGVQSSTGAFVPLDVPPPCREVWSEAAKDACFGRVAKEAIVADPVGFWRRMPSKWAVTLDYFGAAPWYLHASNGEAFPYRAKEVLGTLETVVARLALVLALVAGAQTPGQRRRLRMVLAGVGVLFACQVHGYPAYALLAVQVLLLGVEELGQASPLLPFTAATILATFAVHGVFFGAGRYGLMVAPLVMAMAVNAWPKVSRRASRDVSVEMTR